MIYVRSRPGRKAYFEGRVIPEDQFVPVAETPSIRRLIDVWDDVEVQGGGENPPALELTPVSRRRPAPPTE